MWVWSVDDNRVWVWSVDDIRVWPVDGNRVWVGEYKNINDHLVDLMKRSFSTALCRRYRSLSYSSIFYLGRMTLWMKRLRSLLATVSPFFSFLLSYLLSFRIF